MLKIIRAVIFMLKRIRIVYIMLKSIRYFMFRRIRAILVMLNKIFEVLLMLKRIRAFFFYVEKNPSSSFYVEDNHWSPLYVEENPWSPFYVEENQCNSFVFSYCLSSYQEHNVWHKSGFIRPFEVSCSTMKLISTILWFFLSCVFVCQSLRLDRVAFMLWWLRILSTIASNPFMEYSCVKNTSICQQVMH